MAVAVDVVVVVIVVDAVAVVIAFGVADAAEVYVSDADVYVVGSIDAAGKFQ